MKTLPTAYRATDLEISLDFYAALGYREVSHVDIGNGTTLTMLKFPMRTSSHSRFSTAQPPGPPSSRLWL